MNVRQRRTPLILSVLQYVYRSTRLMRMIAVASVALCTLCSQGPVVDPARCRAVDALPRISPDYSAIVLPPNSAPVNFSILEPGTRFLAEFRGAKSGSIMITAKGRDIIIPQGQWRTLLAANSGSTITITISARDSSGPWTRFRPIIDSISRDSIDRYLVYRLMPPLYTLHGRMGVYQRDLTSFAEKPFWLNRMSQGNCMNCHTFKRNDPDYMVAHMRGGAGNGTLIVRGGKPIKVNTATEFNNPAGAPAWHPGGRLIAFSVNTVRQFFHAVGDNREGIDKGSKIIIYDIETNTISSSPELSDPAWMTTQPEWSPDGRHLYFCRAPQFPKDSVAAHYSKIRYDLVRIQYDADRNTWGTLEIVLSHEKNGLSASFPRISPDGKFLLCTMMPYGTFPVFRPGGDLHLLNLQSGLLTKLPVNSDAPEGFHSWSSNGRWFVFSSKRMDGMSMRPYFSHLDSLGNASKPFLLPQKSPHYYESLLKTYNLPELISRPVTLSPQRLVRAFSDNARIRTAKLDNTIKKRLDSLKTAPPTGEAGYQRGKSGTTH